MHGNTVISIVIKYESLLLEAKENYNLVEEKYANCSIDLYKPKDNQVIKAHLGQWMSFILN